MLNKILKKIIGNFGYKLIDKDLIKNERLISSHSFYSLEFTLEKIFSKDLVSSLIQIGANDGKRFDNLNKFIVKYSPLSILVEPIKTNFQDLKKNYKNQKNIYFENSAISVNNEIQYLYKVRDNKIINYEEHIKGITSFDIDHLTKHGVIRSHIEKEKVNSISILNLLLKYNINNLDLLMIDAEGYDAEISIDFLKNTKLRPIIILEYIHIKNKLFKILIDLLTKKNFYFLKINENLICFPKENELLKKNF